MHIESTGNGPTSLETFCTIALQLWSFVMGERKAATTTVET